MLVTLEGIDGSGKSAVHDALRDEFGDAVFTHEPTDSWLGDAAKRSIDSEDPMTTYLVFLADHSSHVESTIKPALQGDSLVICDRYIDSRLAYQSITLRDVIDNPEEWILDTHQWSVFPDLTILLDLDAGTAVNRIEPGDVFEQRGFLGDVRRKYRDISEVYSDRYRVIDASRDIDTVTRDCASIIKGELD